MILDVQGPFLTYLHHTILCCLAATMAVNVSANHWHSHKWVCHRLSAYIDILTKCVISVTDISIMGGRAKLVAAVSESYANLETWDLYYQQWCCTQKLWGQAYSAVQFLHNVAFKCNTILLKVTLGPFWAVVFKAKNNIFPNPNQVVFVPKPNQLMSTALLHTEEMHISSSRSLQKCTFLTFILAFGLLVGHANWMAFKHNQVSEKKFMFRRSHDKCMKLTAKREWCHG